MHELQAEPLFVAITRPALIWGVPLEAFSLSAIVAVGASFVATGALVAFVPMWVLALLVCKVLAAKDPLIFAERFAWMLTLTSPFGANTSGGYWGCSSMSPLAFAPRRQGRDR